MFLIKKSTVLLVLSIALLFTSCGEDPTTDTSDPENLVVSINLSETEPGLMTIAASADNTVEYQFLLGYDEQLIETNASGNFQYTFEVSGSYNVQIRAIGKSGRYLKETRQVVIVIDNNISIGEGYSTPLEYDGYTLVWTDEFNGTNINTSNWTFETGAGGWGNNEWQYYRQENAWVEEGTLIIEARNEIYSGSEYTSTRMITQGKQSFKYGRIDIRALLPEGQGIWPALWMLGENFSSAGWPKCGEIDIMEMIGGSNRENTTHGTLHWDNNGDHASSGGSKTLSSGTFADKYHVFTIIWDETSITWFVDDQQFYVLDITPAGLSEFHQTFFFIFNVAVGGNWPGYPDSSTSFPQRMKVDYVRVFQEN